MVWYYLEQIDSGLFDFVELSEKAQLILLMKMTLECYFIKFVRIQSQLDFFIYSLSLIKVLIWVLLESNYYYFLFILRFFCLLYRLNSHWKNFIICVSLLVMKLKSCRDICTNHLSSKRYIDKLFLIKRNDHQFEQDEEVQNIFS